jgi:hypothetical protein
MESTERKNWNHFFCHRVSFFTDPDSRARKEHILFCEKTPLWFYQKVLWNWYHQHAWVFRLTTYLVYLVNIPLGTNCAPLLADLFLYSYEADFIQGFLKKNENRLAQSFNFTFCYIDDVRSLNNSRFGNFVDRIYPIELEIKDTTDTDTCWWYQSQRT